MCRELGRDFPTWATDDRPETVANRIDTAVSVNEGGAFTAVFDGLCPGELR